MKEKYSGIIIADIHWGTVEPENMLSQLKLNLLSYIENLKELDFLIIAGDYFDSKISLNSNTSRHAIRFIKNLLDLVEPFDTKVRILKGTKSHDERQLEILSVFENTYDFRIINSVEKELLFPNFNVLYIPEEYMTDKKEFYSDYFSDTYNMIVGHGMFTEVGFVALAQLSEETNQKAPIFNSDEMISICKGPIFFGHIHIAQNIKDRIFYTGSPIRSCFGEVEDKGFFHTEINVDGEFENRFIVNTITQKYDTIEIHIDGDVSHDNTEVVQVIMSTYEDYFTMNKLDYDKLRLKINIKNMDYMESGLISLIRETFSRLNGLTLKINNMSKLEKEEQIEQKVNELRERYSFLFSTTLEPEHKISQYIKLQFEEDITVNDIIKYTFKGGI